MTGRENEDDARGTARRRVQVVNKYGLHMRPSTKFVNLVDSFRSEVWVHYRGTKANGKRILDMTGLAAECGATLDLAAQGLDAEDALAAPWPSWSRRAFTWTTRVPDALFPDRDGGSPGR